MLMTGWVLVLIAAACVTVDSEEQACPGNEMDTTLEADMSAVLLQTGLQRSKQKGLKRSRRGHASMHADSERKRGECISNLLLASEPWTHPGFSVTEAGASPLEPAKVWGTPGALKKVYYINLDKSTDRRDFMESQLNQSGVPYKRFSAIPGADVKAGKYDRILRNRSMCKLMLWEDGFWEEGIHLVNEDGSLADTVWNGLGDMVSHHLIYEEILQEDPASDDLYLVLEDDAILPEGWQNTEEYMSQIPPDWTSVNLGQWDWLWPRCRDIVNNVSLLHTHPVWSPVKVGKPAPSYFGSAAILVTPQRLPLVVEELYKQQLCHCDVAHLSSGKTRQYAFWPVYTGLQDSLHYDAPTRTEDDLWDTAA
mmetsp:Transcript_78657/g.148447  ORF Transcript_78657/g.148447 Transcript_78657/m.148447 type:complete len:366 (-) Transcript_78657:97-1194(-)